jgi:hypothetical protein
MMRRILALVATLAVSLGILTTAPATATDTPCTTVWLTTPSYFGHLNTGQRRCLDLTDTANGWTRVYRYDDPTRQHFDWVNAFTQTPPNNGRVKTTADAVRALFARHGMHVQFANRDLAGRLGCSGGFINSVSGAYAGSPPYPGRGLVRIGTGFTDRCMRDKRIVMNVAAHEMGHVDTERNCGTTRPRIVYRPEEGFNRIEEVASAYGMKYFGATETPGGVRPSLKDFWRANKIHAGWCG